MQLDSTTGLYYLRARYMDPSTGTFISMDTYGGSIFDSVSLHKYLYANANPVMNSDPTGYFTLPEFGIANAIGKTIDTIQNDAFALAVWRSFKAGFMCAAYDAYRQWRTTRKIDWGHVLETFVVGTSVSVVFGGSAVLAASLRSVAIYTALGASAFTLGAFGLAGAAADGEAGYYDLAILDVIFSLQAMKGAEKCFDNAYEVATAKNAAETTTNISPENTNKASKFSKNQDPFMSEDYYENYKIQAEWVKDGVKHYYYQEPNTTRITYRFDPRAHAWERSVTVSDNFGRINYRIDMGDHGMPESHSPIHIHKYEINTSGTSYSENGLPMFHNDNSAYVNSEPPAKPWH